ncbi:MAG: ethanolamine utilization protein EutN [Planctomycetes bacterium]|nr:ethanolamine utilization protein EutN [Planctomycetota bacterium]
MYLARVLAPIVVPIHHPALTAHPLLLVARVEPDGRLDARAHHRVALDTIGAGEGDLVLVLEEGNSARQLLDDRGAPVRNVVVGFVDEVEIEGRITLRHEARPQVGAHAAAPPESVR